MNIKKQTTTEKTIISLSGVIDESSNFEQIGTPTGAVEINGQEVSKINSNGVKLWINFFTKLAQTSQLSFSNLSPVLVEQLNSLSNFCAGCPVTSLRVPFACTKCHKETIISMTVDELKQNPEPSPIACSHCGGTAEFDDLPEEYFCCLENLD